MKSFFEPFTADSIEQRLIEIERQIGDLRAEQSVLVHEFDKKHMHRSDGSRTLTEWLQTHLDLSRETARALVTTGRGCTANPQVQEDLAYRETFDRAVATHRLIEAGATEAEARTSMHMNIDTVHKMTRAQRRLRAKDEHREYAERFVSIRPTLDRSAWTLSGRLPGPMGSLIEEALAKRADAIRRETGGDPGSRSQRQADALTAICQDSMEGDSSAESPTTPTTAGVVTVFVDARKDDPVGCASEISAGPQIGPAVLEALLCGGSVRVVGMDRETPIATTATTRAIPPAMRAAVLHRDGGCSIDGCHSRYRLEPHHIVAWSAGGDHSIDNLTTLCWYHHHVAVHGEGFVVDIDSPPGRRRLQRGSSCVSQLAA